MSRAAQGIPIKLARRRIYEVELGRLACPSGHVFKVQPYIMHGAPLGLCCPHRPIPEGARCGGTAYYIPTAPRKAMAIECTVAELIWMAKHAMTQDAALDYLGVSLDIPEPAAA